MAEQPTDDAQSFVAFLATVRPEIVDELSEELQALVAKIRETGGAGQITLTLKIEPIDPDAPSTLKVKDEIRVRAPQHFRGPSIAYADRHNHIGNTAPGTMPLFEDLDVDSETGEVREPKSR